MRVPPALLLLVLAPAAAGAAEKEWTPAPVPNAGGGATVQPAARAGSSTGPDHDAPFSGMSRKSTAAGGATSSNQVDDAGTPNLSR